MYRKSLEKSIDSDRSTMSDNAIMDIQFLNRLCQLPLVTASWAQLAGLYSHAKESNRILKYTLDKAESGVVGVASTAIPLVHKFEKPITILDGIACGQLSKLEEKYPIISKPADVWVSKGQDMYGNSVLKPSVDKLTTMKDVGVQSCAKVYDVTVKPSLDTYSRVKNYAAEKGTVTYNALYSITIGPVVNLGTATFSTAKNYSVGTVQAASQYSKDSMTGVMNYGMGKVGSAMGTHYGKALQTRMDDFVDKADQCVDYYLPEPKVTEPEKKIQLDAVEPETPFTKACVVTTKARRRMYQKALTELSNVKMRTEEAIGNLKHTIDLIQYEKVAGVMSDAKTVAVDGAKFAGTKLQYYWEEMNKTGEEVESKEGDGSQNDKMSVERRLIATARHLTQKIKLGVVAVSSTAGSLLPSSVSDLILNSKTHTLDLYNSFANASTLGDLSHTMLDQAKEKLDYLTTALSFASDYVMETINVDWLIRKFASMQNAEKKEATKQELQSPRPEVASNGWEQSNGNHNGKTPDGAADLQK